MDRPPAFAAAVAAARRAAGTLVEVDAVVAEGIADALDAALARRLAAVPPLARDERASLEDEAAAVTLLRVSVRRRRNDFVGAALLLAAGFGGLGRQERSQLAVERALVAAELTGPAALHLPATAGERDRLAARLYAAGRHVDTALAADDRNATAHLLAGALGRCAGDERAAADHLDQALAGLPPEHPVAHRETIRLHRDVAALAAGDAPAAVAAARLLAALDAGARASPELLRQACDLLAAGGADAEPLRRRADHLEALTPPPPSDA